MLENSIDKGGYFIGKGDNSVLEDLVNYCYINLC